MRAARIQGWGAPPVVDEVPEPVAGDGDTLIRVAAACLAHIDRSVASGTFFRSPDLPYTPGVDCSGEVVTSDRFEPGTRVWTRGAGLGVARDGTCAELAVTRTAAVRACPDGVDLDVAGCFFSPATTAHVAVHEVGRLEEGERVAIVGAGGAVGSLAVQLAAGTGAVEIVGTVSRDERTDDVPKPGVPAVGTGEELLDALRGHTDGVDLLIDTIGGPDLPTRLGGVRPGGRAVVLGYTAGTTVELDIVRDLLTREVRLLPVNMITREDAAREVAGDLLGRFARGELELPVTAHRLDEVAEAWRDLGAGRIRGRLVIHP